MTWTLEKNQREKTMKNLIKKYGITEEQLKEGIDIVAKNLELICDAKVMFAVKELLAEGDIKPQSNDLEELIKEALKDYRGNNEVIVTTTSGGSVYVEDYDSSELVSKNEELENEVENQKAEIEDLSHRIEELEEELEEYE